MCLLLRRGLGLKQAEELELQIELGFVGITDISPTFLFYLQLGFGGLGIKPRERSTDVLEEKRKKKREKRKQKECSSLNVLVRTEIPISCQSCVGAWDRNSQGVVDQD